MAAVITEDLLTALCYPAGENEPAVVGVGRVAVVVATHNAARFIRPTLEAIGAQMYAPTWVVVVDNASADETVALVGEHFPSVLVMPLPDNRGFGQANNLGISRALDMGADFVMLVNQDAVLHPRAIEALVAEAASHEDFGLLGAFQLTYDGRDVDGTFPVPAELHAGCAAGSLRHLYPAPFVPAVGVLILRQALREVGGFDPLFFMYHEDQDLCRRLVKAGWRVGVVPRAMVRHWNGSSHARRSLRWELNWAWSDAVLHLKSSPRSFPVAYVTLIKVWLATKEHSVIRTLARALAFGRAAIRAPEIRRHRTSRPHEFGRHAIQDGRTASDG